MNSSMGKYLSEPNKAHATSYVILCLVSSLVVPVVSRLKFDKLYVPVLYAPLLHLRSKEKSVNVS